MNKKPFSFLLPGFYFILSVIFAVVLVFLQNTLLSESYDFAGYYYKTGSALTTVFTWLVPIFAVILLTAVFVLKKYMKVKPAALPDGKIPVTLASAVSGCALLVMLYTAISDCMAKGKFTTSVSPSLIYVAMLIAAIPTAFFFILIVFSKNENNEAIAILGFAPIVWFALYLFCMYFDRSTPFNDPVRTLTEVSLISLMIYMLYELRFRVDINKVHPVGYFVSSFIAILTVFPSSVTKLIQIANGNLDSGLTYSLITAAELGFGLYVAARLVSFALCKNAVEYIKPEKKKKAGTSKEA